MLNPFRLFLSFLSASDVANSDSDSSTSYSYSYADNVHRSSSSSFPFSSYFKSNSSSDYFVYILTQLAPFFVLLGLPAFALLARAHWRAVLSLGGMVLESLFGSALSLPWSWGFGSGSGANGEKTEERRRRRKERKNLKDETQSDKEGEGSVRRESTDGESELEDEDEDEDLYYPGLVNISGTYCFLNSVLQATASLAYLQPYLDAIHNRAVNLDVPSPVVDTLQETLQALNTPKSSRSSIRPVPIINALSQPVPGAGGKSKLFASREHQDAQELFQLLSECIKSEAQAVDAEAQRDRGLGAFATTSRDTSRPASSASSLKDGESTVGTTTTTTDLIASSVFDGLTANRRSCVACGYTEAVMHFAFATWSLALPSVGYGFGASSCSLQECLADYTRLELLTDCVCRRCSMRATHARLVEEAERLAEATQPGGPASGSQYKKKKAREARKVERAVKLLIEEGRIEEDVPKGVKMERVVSPASTKQAMIARPPKVLVLHLNRSLHFSSYTSPTRNSIRVNFPEILDLTPYTTSGQLNTTPSAPISTPPITPPPHISSLYRNANGNANGPIQVPRSTTPTQGMYAHPRVLYRLSAVVAHYGAHSFGHYVCFRRKPRFLKRKGGRSGKERERRATPMLPVMPCPYGCECELCTTYGPVRDLDPTAPISSSSSERSRPKPGTPTPGKGWLRISDDSVEEVGLERVLAEGSGAFLLFYEQVRSANAAPGPGSWMGPSFSSTGVGSSASSVSGPLGTGEGRGTSPGTGFVGTLGSHSAYANPSLSPNFNFLNIKPPMNNPSAYMSSGSSINHQYHSQNQTIGVGVGNVYQHLVSSRDTPRSSEETVRPVDIIVPSSSGFGSGHRSVVGETMASSFGSSSSSFGSSSGSSFGSASASAFVSTFRGEDRFGGGSGGGSGSGSGGSSVSSSLVSEGALSSGSGSSSWAASGSGLVRPRIVRRTTAGRRERSKEKKEKQRGATEEPQLGETSLPNGSAFPSPSFLANGSALRDGIVKNDSSQIVNGDSKRDDPLSESIVKVELPSPPRSRSASPSRLPHTPPPPLISNANSSSSTSPRAKGKLKTSKSKSSSNISHIPRPPPLSTSPSTLSPSPSPSPSCSILKSTTVISSTPSPTPGPSSSSLHLNNNNGNTNNDASSSRKEPPSPKSTKSSSSSMSPDAQHDAPVSPSSPVSPTSASPPKKRKTGKNKSRIPARARVVSSASTAASTSSNVSPSLQSKGSTGSGSGSGSSSGKGILLVDRSRAATTPVGSGLRA